MAHGARHVRHAALRPGAPGGWERFLEKPTFFFFFKPRITTAVCDFSLGLWAAVE